MTIILELPEEIARHLSRQWMDLPRVALESLALEAYRTRKLSTEQMRRLLGFETRQQLDAFLKDHEVWLDYGIDDLEQDRDTHQRIGL